MLDLVWFSLILICVHVCVNAGGGERLESFFLVIFLTFLFPFLFPFIFSIF